MTRSLSALLGHFIPLLTNFLKEVWIVIVALLCFYGLSRLAMAAAFNTEMQTILKKLGIEECSGNFERENISPDIVHFLSKQEFSELGVSRREDMVKLREECVKYGSASPRVEKTSGSSEFVIPERVLRNLIDTGFMIRDIAKILSVSESTIYRRMRIYGISKSDFSDLNEDEVDICVGKTVLEFPNCGETLLSQLLRQKGIYIQRWRLRDSLHRIDLNGLKDRKKGTLRRRVYDVKGANHLWHIDSNHKLIRWHFIIAGGIDGFSRLVVFLNCVDNNKADTILRCFMEGVKNYGIPERVRSDKGLENISVADFMIAQKGTGRRSMITGPSVHNQRIERLWRDVYSGVLSYYYNLFYFMEDEGILDPLNDSHIAALHYVFLPKINEKLQLWRDAWAGHRLRTAHNSPLALWVAGQFQSPVGISESELLFYGAEGVVDAVEPEVPEQGRPIINGIATINQDCLNYLQDNIPHDWVSNNHGMDIYVRARDIIRDHNGI